ncbi:MAG: hypothetical protein ACREOQ_22865 [Gemmatimonadales bacterium]
MLDDAVRAYRNSLGQRLVAAYALGSLAHGGFSVLVSDVDLGLVLADPLDSSDRGMVQAVADGVKARGSVLHERLSVFWGTPSTLRVGAGGGRFPPLDRLDLLENGQLLDGEEARQGMVCPDRAELLVAGAEFALDILGPGKDPVIPASRDLRMLASARGQVLEEIRCPELLLTQSSRHLTKIVLFPVRLLYTAATGKVGANQVAAEYYLASGAPSASLVSAALAWRVTRLLHGAAAELLARELLPLYLYYIDDHIAHLSALGQVDLERAFVRWRGRLLN